MKNLGIYLLAAGLTIFVVALAFITMGDVSGIPQHALGAVKYIWAGGIFVLIGVIGFFIWLARKGR